MKGKPGLPGFGLLQFLQNPPLSRFLSTIWYFYSQSLVKEKKVAHESILSANSPEITHSERSCYVSTQPCSSEISPGCSQGNARPECANDNSLHSSLLETSSHYNGEQAHQLAPNSSGETIVGTKQSGASGSWDMSTQACMEIEWTQQSKCIKCGEGGEVLVCSDRVCRLAVHEKCMNCSAAFDDMGDFYCPYCWYRCAIAKSNEARKRAMSSKKALSTFLDTKALCGNQQKEKTKSSNGKKPPSTSERSCNENEYRLDYDEVYNQSVQAEKDQQDGFALDFEQHQIVAQHQWHMKSSVDDGDGNLYSREEGTTSADGSFQGFVANQKFDGVKQLAAVKVREMIQEEHSREVGDCQDEGVAEDQQVAEPLNDCHLEEETTLDGDFSVLTKGKQVDAKMTEENLGRREEEEQMQPQAQETTAAIPGGDPASLVHEKVNIGFRIIDSCREKNAGDGTKEVIVSSKSIQPRGPSKKLTNQIFPNERRKKLLWKTDEEEMLKVDAESKAWIHLAFCIMYTEVNCQDSVSMVFAMPSLHEQP
ncbi:hypothetical protein CK203_017796 [Vitis vinifera]|uniref:Zinc finger PHD-type domain-containing protein n=1 Tax=Vitis vinifera TaxID=29760 RepID=A0A438JHA4_VITVI|nr:hypothetical protein CK203_017796 [Vitis vinifera]